MHTQSFLWNSSARNFKLLNIYIYNSLTFICLHIRYEIMISSPSTTDSVIGAFTTYYIFIIFMSDRCSYCSCVAILKNCSDPILGFYPRETFTITLGPLVTLLPYDNFAPLWNSPLKLQFRGSHIWIIVTNATSKILPIVWAPSSNCLCRVLVRQFIFLEWIDVAD